MTPFRQFQMQATDEQGVKQWLIFWICEECRAVVWSADADAHDAWHKSRA